MDTCIRLTNSQMNNRPTPETDKNLWDHGDEIDPSMRPDSNGNWVPEEFARKLERERDEARKSLDEMSKYLAQATAQRDHAETELRKWMAFVKGGAK